MTFPARRTPTNSPLYRREFSRVAAALGVPGRRSFAGDRALFFCWGTLSGLSFRIFSRPALVAGPFAGSGKEGSFSGGGRSGRTYGGLASRGF